jgi:osmotically-inducible protein OsmY
MKTLMFQIACMAAFSAAVMSTAFGAAIASNARSNDLLLRDAVVNAFREDPGVNPRSIEVSVKDGWVTLTGTVDDLLAQRRAPIVAMTVQGVRRVTNLTTMHPAFKSDAAVARDIRGLLDSNPALDSQGIRVEVTEGTARLSGVVDSWQAKRIAGRTALSVPGVWALENDIAVALEARRNDDSIRLDIWDRLNWDPRANTHAVEVVVRDGVVTLRGDVGSQAARLPIIRDAWVAGVHAVEARGLKAHPWAQETGLRRTGFAERSDQDIEGGVLHRLALDPQVNAFDISASVDAGRVTLRGMVSSPLAGYAALLDAHNVPGVRSVEECLRIGP